MIDAQIAQKLVDRVSAVLDYNVNIMDETGTIIASHDIKRVGSFHEVAYAMMHNGEELIEVFDSEKLLGTKPGINMAIKNKNVTVGIVGITGNPDTIRPIALLLRETIESLLEYELQQQSLAKLNNRTDNFFSKLVYREDRDLAELVSEASYLGYRPDAYRIAVYIYVERQDERDKVFDFCKKNQRRSKEDMIMRSESGNTLLFIALNGNNQNLMDLKETVELYLTPIIDASINVGINNKYIVGSLHNDLYLYRNAYQQCRWIKNNITEGWGGLIFFYDYLYEYLLSKVPLVEQKNAIGTLVDLYPEDFWEDYVNIIGAMNRNNNNMVKASADLHMHRNTLVYRYNRIRAKLGINPMENARDDLFSRLLFYYLTHR